MKFIILSFFSDFHFIFSIYFDILVARDKLGVFVLFLLFWSYFLFSFILFQRLIRSIFLFWLTLWRRHIGNFRLNFHICRLLHLFSMSFVFLFFRGLIFFFPVVYAPNLSHFIGVYYILERDKFSFVHSYIPYSLSSFMCITHCKVFIINKLFIL